jgi:hypothetical protein
VVKVPPFEIPPFELKMAWSPLLQHNADHQWLRRLIVEVAEEVHAEFVPFGARFESAKATRVPHSER